jgi:hypothetical protein
VENETQSGFISIAVFIRICAIAAFIYLASLVGIGFYVYRYANNQALIGQAERISEEVVKTNLIIREQVKVIEQTNTIIERQLIKNEKTIADCSNILLCSNLADAIREYKK